MDYYGEIIDSSDIILTGRNELPRLFGKAETAVATLLEKKDRIIVIKDGAKYTYVHTRKEAFRVGAFPAVEVDATGAGDSFDGTFLAMLCEGADLRTAAIYGNAAGAKAVGKKGPMEGNTGRKELDELVRENPHVAIETI
jgi:sugar/nucleoside kinase (ribokinase family)